MAKAYDYVITLKQRSFKAFDLVSQLLIFISLAVFAYTAYLYKEVRIQYLVLILLVIGSWIYTLRNAAKKSTDPYYRFTLSLASLGWFFANHGNPWIGGALLLIAFLERQVKFPEEIGFSEESIIFNSFPKKEYQWNDISNVVLKDGLLTIDRRNNKLFQKETQSEVDATTESEFNAFCSRQLNRTS